MRAAVPEQLSASGLSIVDSQDLGVGGIYVRNNTVRAGSRWPTTDPTIEMKVTHFKPIAVGALLVVALGHALGQGPAPPNDIFQQRVAGVNLDDQSIVDGIAMLSGEAGLAVSVEYPLGATIAGPAPALKTFVASVGSGTVAEILDRLCVIDPTFAWTRNGNMANVPPRDHANDPSYLPNRRIDELTFRKLRGADEAVVQIADWLPGPREQIAILGTGMSLSFAQPWSTTLRNVTVRDVLDEIARQLGPSYGWQFSGAQDFRIVVFHQGILPKPSRTNVKQSQGSGAR